MRTKDVLFDFERIAILLQYLYISPDHRITFNNGVTDLRIRMNDELEILCQNLSFPNLPETNFTADICSPNQCLGIIELLENMPAEEFPKSFKNRWEEINELTKSNLALNRK